MCFVDRVRVLGFDRVWGVNKRDGPGMVLGFSFGPGLYNGFRMLVLYLVDFKDQSCTF